MLPVLFSFANFSVTSFGFFLVLSLILGLFLIWRASRVYEVDPEKVLDLYFLTLFSAFLFARLYFVATHLRDFDEPLKVLLFNRYPGFSFWGGLLGGILAIRFFSPRLNLIFWQVLDFAAIGLFLGVAVSSLGCLLGSCGYGVVSDLPFAVSQAGLIGKRFPLQIVEGLLFLAAFKYLWRGVLRFHSDGSVAALGLVFLGAFKFFLEFLRGDTQTAPVFGISLGFIYSALTFISGVVIYYKLGKRSVSADLRYLFSVLRSSSRRKVLVQKLQKSCYNFLINFRLSVKKGARGFLKSLNVKSNPTKF